MAPLVLAMLSQLMQQGGKGGLQMPGYNPVFGGRRGGGGGVTDMMGAGAASGTGNPTAANSLFGPPSGARTAPGGGPIGPGGNNVGVGGPGAAKPAGGMNPILMSFLQSLMKRGQSAGPQPQPYAPVFSRRGTMQQPVLGNA